MAELEPKFRKFVIGADDTPVRFKPLALPGYGVSFKPLNYSTTYQDIQPFAIDITPQQYKRSMKELPLETKADAGVAAVPAAAEVKEAKPVDPPAVAAAAASAISTPAAAKAELVAPVAAALASSGSTALASEEDEEDIDEEDIYEPSNEEIVASMTKQSASEYVSAGVASADVRIDTPLIPGSVVPQTPATIGKPSKPAGSPSTSSRPFTARRRSDPPVAEPSEQKLSPVKSAADKRKETIFVKEILNQISKDDEQFATYAYKRLNVDDFKAIARNVGLDMSKKSPTTGKVMAKNGNDIFVDLMKSHKNTLKDYMSRNVTVATKDGRPAFNTTAVRA